MFKKLFTQFQQEFVFFLHTQPALHHKKEGICLKMSIFLKGTTPRFLKKPFYVIIYMKINAPAEALLRRISID